MLTPDPSLDLITIVLLSGLVPGFLLSILLLMKAKVSKSNIYLGVFVSVITLSVLELFLNHTDLILYVIHLYNFSEPLQFLLAPFLLIYFRSLSGKLTWKRDFFHLLPFLLYSLYMLHEIAAPATQKYNNFIANYHPDESFILVSSPVDLDPWNIRNWMTSIVVYAQMSLYVLWVILFEIRPLVKLRSQAEKRRWIWVFALFALTGLIVFFTTKYMLPMVFGENMVGVFLVFFIYSIWYFLFNESSFFRSKSVTQSLIAEDQIDKKLSQLKNVLENEKLYTDGDLSLKELATKINLSEHQLSQLINDQLNINFFGLINKYRVEEARRILLDPNQSHLKVEEIGYKVGYNSKSAFFSAFKKTFKSTPQSIRNHPTK